VGEWHPNTVARRLPEPLHFETVWVVGLGCVENGEYVYNVTNLDVSEGNAPVFKARNREELRPLGRNPMSIGSGSRSEERDPGAYFERHQLARDA
jgi:hypothetical protein